LVEKTQVEGEQEYLFVPYSVFTVRQVTWTKGRPNKPHVIELEAAIDNMDEEDEEEESGIALPLAPWY
jgi:hypothetical protein